MAPLAGWYDDPRDGLRLRYWDGEAWTDHVTAKDASSTAAQTPTSTPVSTPVFPGGEEAQRQRWNYGQPAQTSAPPAASDVGGPPPTYPVGQQPPYPQSGQHPQYPQYPQYPGWSQSPTVPPGTIVTPDGAVVTSWVKRLGARLLDNIFVFFGSLPLTGYFFYRAVDAQTKEMDAGNYHAFSISNEVMHWELAAIAIILVVQLVYETFSLRRWGATPGKRILNISVRGWDQGGRLGWSEIGRRVVLVYGLWLADLVPVLGAVALIVLLLDYLWPLWDKRNQALHDKLAGTVVIEGPRAPH
jgi:uncharacterized RDD family membrane protein YckC